MLLWARWWWCLPVPKPIPPPPPLDPPLPLIDGLMQIIAQVRRRREISPRRDLSPLWNAEVGSSLPYPLLAFSRMDGDLSSSSSSSFPSNRALALSAAAGSLSKKQHISKPFCHPSSRLVAPSPFSSLETQDINCSRSPRSSPRKNKHV